MSSGDTTPTRANAVSSMGRVVVVAVLAIAAAGCAQVPAGSGAEQPQSAPSTTEAAVATTVADTTTTSSAPVTTTTTTLADKSQDPPPKPEGGPDIELLPAVETGAIVYSPETGGTSDGEPLAPYFSFEEVSGYGSYRVTHTSIFTTADNAFSSFTEVNVVGASIQLRATSGDDVGYEVILLEDDTFWVKQFGEWIQGAGDGDYVYATVLALAMILPDAQHGALYDAFDSLAFRDWELIDGAWYARYDPSPEFVAALLDDGLSPDDIPELKGAVWVSPLGFMHSYELELEDAEAGQMLNSTWRLSDLGSTTVSLPEM